MSACSDRLTRLLLPALALLLPGCSPSETVYQADCGSAFSGRVRLTGPHPTGVWEAVDEKGAQLLLPRAVCTLVEVAADTKEPTR